MATRPQTVLACGQCWIEIQLLDDDDVGVAREPYWIQLPNGEVREGRLDDKGLARFDPIPCGTCLVRFPRSRDPELLKVAARAKDDHWLELRLLDADGDPLHGEEYAVTLSDSSTRKGTLDRKGFARLDGIPEGMCRVTFPKLDKAEFYANAHTVKVDENA